MANAPDSFFIGIALRYHCWPDGGSGRAAQGHGICNRCRTSSQRWTLHRLHPDDRIRAAGHIARTQRQFDDDPCDSRRRTVGISGPRR